MWQRNECEYSNLPLWGCKHDKRVNSILKQIEIKSRHTPVSQRHWYKYISLKTIMGIKNEVEEQRSFMNSIAAYNDQLGSFISNR